MKNQRLVPKCPVCGKDTVEIDYPEPMVYHNEDTKWGIPPCDDEPFGLLVANTGALPIEVIHPELLPG